MDAAETIETCHGLSIGNLKVAESHGGKTRAVTNFGMAA